MNLLVGISIILILQTKLGFIFNKNMKLKPFVAHHLYVIEIV